jgi:hypothetical protein
MNGRIKLKAFLIISIFLLGIACTAAAGRTIYVDDNGPADFNNIQAAIDDSNDGDTIIVADGTYTGVGNRDIDFFGKAITLRSENGPQNCIIDCNGTKTDPHRGFIFQSGEELDSLVEGFTITNGYAPMEETGPPFDIYESVGGAILCWGSSPTINHCVFTGNSANSVDSFAFGFGGAISCYGYSSPTITYCVFNGNSAEHGGGVSNYLGSSPILANCLFRNNSANGSNPDGPGGGMYIDSYSDPVLLNCTFSANSANGDVGGGIFFQASEPIITNCIFWGNTDTGGTDESAQISYSSGNPVINYTCIQGLTGLFGGIGNIGEKPFFGDPCNGDYHLKSQAGRWTSASSVEPDANEGRWTKDEVTSPCIDAGNINSPIGFEPFPNGGRVNMGAYGGTAEASKSYFGGPVCEIIVAGDINGDCKVNFLDFRIMAFHWLQDNNP